MGTHLHHIIPKHMGGTDDPKNLVELTVEEHAAAHLQLFEEHGNWKDLFAFRALSGQIDTDDIRRELSRLSRAGTKHTPEAIQKIKNARANQQSSGWKWSESSKEKQSKAHTGKILTDDHKKNIGDSCRGIPKVKTHCPHCGKIGGGPQMARWHFENCKLKI